jgi:hypothetical protein
VIKHLASATLLLTTVWLIGCAPSRHAEQRVVALPADNPNATLSTASTIGQRLIGEGFFTLVQKQFPKLSEAQFQGLFLRWDAGPIAGKDRVFFLTGIRYSGPMPESKAVADFCESQVKAAVANYFPEPDPR